MIHRYWSGPPPSTEPWLHHLIVKLHPRAHVAEWTDDTLPADVVAWLDERDALVDRDCAGQHRGNMVRWWALATHGGIWLDHDVIPLQPLDRLPGVCTAALRNQRCSCLLAFPAEHPLPLAMLDAINAAEHGPPRRSVDVSGDRLMTSLIDPTVARVQLPYDALGTSMGVAVPAVMHLWHSASARHYPSHGPDQQVPTFGDVRATR